MRCFYSRTQDRHAPSTFMLRGAPAPSPERPERAERLAQALSGLGLHLEEPECIDSPGLRERLARIHTPRYLHFLETIHARWQAMPGASALVIPNVHPVGGGHHYPRHPVGQAGWHLHDMACPLDADSFIGIMASAASAEAAADAVVAGESSAYALCRPPGHHAGPDRGGGFCFLNNSALAASVLRERFARVAVIDVDVHHGNGTQDIFYARGDVWTGSIHVDPSDYYPFFWGGEDERGEGNGQGANLNVPLPLGSTGKRFLEGLERLLDGVDRFAPEAVIIALGLDAHKDDPLAGMMLETEDFESIGERLAQLTQPIVVVQEGGYPTASLGSNLAAFMRGFQSRKRS